MRLGLDEVLPDAQLVELAADLFPPTFQGLSRPFKYRMTNRDIGELLTFCGELEGRSVLAVTGSSLPLMSFLSLPGAPRKLHGFDYSPKQVAYNYLVKAAIKAMSLAEFRDFFGYDRRQPRTDECKATRRALLTEVPEPLRRYVPRQHELTCRDIRLKDCANCLFISDEQSYSRVKANIDRAHFFVFDLNGGLWYDLASMFSDGYFQFVYLSNVLDWICWHRSVSSSDIEGVLAMIGRVTVPGSPCVIDHLAERPTILSRYLQESGAVQTGSYRMYKYIWHMYKLLI